MWHQGSASFCDTSPIVKESSVQLEYWDRIQGSCEIPMSFSSLLPKESKCELEFEMGM